MKWSRPSWLRARSGHAVMALALGGIALIGVAHRVADQQAQDLMALHEDIDIIRISPQKQHINEIIAAFDNARRGQPVSLADQNLNSSGLVDGYWFGDAGIVRHNLPANDHPRT